MDNAMLAVPRERAQNIQRLILDMDRAADATEISRALTL